MHDTDVVEDLFYCILFGRGDFPISGLLVATMAKCDMRDWLFIWRPHVYKYVTRTWSPQCLQVYWHFTVTGHQKA